MCTVLELSNLFYRRTLPSLSGFLVPIHKAKTLFLFEINECTDLLIVTTNFQLYDMEKRI